MTDIEYSENRLLRQRLRDADHEIEERKQAEDRQARDRENEPRHALEFGDYPTPGVVFQFLKYILRAWPRARWEALIDLIHRFLSETRP